MDRSTLLQTLKEIVEADHGEAIDGFDESASLREDLGLDSVDMLTTVMQIQDRFRIVLATEELETIVTVCDFLNLLEEKLKSVSSQAA